MDTKLKDYSSAFDFIVNLESPKKGTIHKDKSVLQEFKTDFFAEGNSFTTQFSIDPNTSHKRIDGGSSYRNVFFSYVGGKIILEEIFIKNRLFDLDETSVRAECTGRTSRLWSEGFRQGVKYYYSLIIPLQTKLDLYFVLDYPLRSGLKFQVGDGMYRIKVLSRKDSTNAEMHFLVIESGQRSTLNVFSKQAFSIQIGLGYLTGHYAGDKGYYFAYWNEHKTDYDHFFYSSLRGSINSSWRPVYANTVSDLVCRIFAS